MKKGVRILIIILTSILSAFLCYEFFGYLILAIRTPLIYSNGKATVFAGMYIMALTYFIFFTLAITSLIIFIKKSGKKK